MYKDNYRLLVRLEYSHVVTASRAFPVTRKFVFMTNVVLDVIYCKAERESEFCDLVCHRMNILVVY